MSTSPRRLPRRIYNERSGEWETVMVTICPPPGDPLLPRPAELEDSPERRKANQEAFGRRGPYSGRKRASGDTDE